MTRAAARGAFRLVGWGRFRAISGAPATVPSARTRAALVARWVAVAGDGESSLSPLMRGGEWRGAGHRGRVQDRPHVILEPVHPRRDAVRIR